MSDIEEPVPSATFPERVMSLLNDEQVQQCMHWLPSGRAFEIHDPEKFEEMVLKAHFNSIKLESFIIRLGKWGFARMDKKINARYMSLTFACELFQRDAPELVSEMKLVNKKGRKLKPPKSLVDVLDTSSKSLVNVLENHPKKVPVIYKPARLQCGQQEENQNRWMMSVSRPLPPRLVQIPVYPPPPQPYQQWQIPQPHYIPPPSQPHVQPTIIYQGSQAIRQISPPLHHPQIIAPQIVHQMPHQVLQPPLEKPIKNDNKSQPKNPKVEKKPIKKVETQLKTEYKQIAEEAEAAVAMMDLAGCNFSYKG